MRFVDEFRDPDLGRALAVEILATVEPGRHYKIMEVCGGHTHAIYKHGVEDLLPPEIELVHGPGCPVCVIPMGRQDDALAIAQRETGALISTHTEAGTMALEQVQRDAAVRKDGRKLAEVLPPREEPRLRRVGNNPRFVVACQRARERLCFTLGRYRQAWCL